MEKTIEIPESVFASAQSLDDLEDWLASRNPEFLASIRSIRNNEDLTDLGQDLTEMTHYLVEN